MFKYGAIFEESAHYYYMHLLPAVPRNADYPQWKGNLFDVYYVVGNTLERLLLDEDVSFQDIRVETTKEAKTNKVSHKCTVWLKENRSSSSQDRTGRRKRELQKTT